MQLDHDQLHKLLALLGESDIQELKLEGDDFRLEVRRNLPGAAPMALSLSLCLFFGFSRWLTEGNQTPTCGGKKTFSSSSLGPGSFSAL